MGFIQDFKDFAFKGNLIDMAVGLVMGTAVAAMVKSFIDHIIMPLVAILAFVIFIALKIASKWMKSAADDAPPSDEVILLTEIRDSLKK